jgi:ketosteroid isomerase-like protein
VDTWLAASKAGDIAAVLILMTADIVFMVPGREPFGKALSPPRPTRRRTCG